MVGSFCEPERYALSDDILITQNGFDCDDRSSKLYSTKSEDQFDQNLWSAEANFVQIPNLNTPMLNTRGFWA